MSGLTFRLLEDDEFAAGQLVADRASGVEQARPALARALAHSEHGRWYGAFDGEQLVGSTRNVACHLTLPGWRHLGPLPDIAVANATWTGVSPTHRRRGILREMQRWHMADARDRGEAALIGTPSQSTIYGRFGHGPVAGLQSVRIATKAADFQYPLLGLGRFRPIDVDREFDAICDVYECYRSRQPGEVKRTAALWDFVRSIAPDSGSPLFWVMYQSADGVDEGYVAYQIVESCRYDRLEKVLRLRELVAITPAAHMALWRFCLDMDLVSAVEGRVPCHDPIRWILADQRALEVRGYVGQVWMRPIDLVLMLEARRYSAADTITIHVVDDFLPDNTGCYTITGDATGSTVARRSGSDGDLSLGVSQLATLILGTSQFVTLAAVGLVEENTSGALHRADVMFSSFPPPSCITPI